MFFRVWLLTSKSVGIMSEARREVVKPWGRRGIETDVKGSDDIRSSNLRTVAESCRLGIFSCRTACKTHAVGILGGGNVVLARAMLKLNWIERIFLFALKRMVFADVTKRESMEVFKIRKFCGSECLLPIASSRHLVSTTPHTWKKTDLLVCFGSSTFR